MSVPRWMMPDRDKPNANYSGVTMQYDEPEGYNGFIISLVDKKNNDLVDCQRYTWPYQSAMSQHQYVKFCINGFKMELRQAGVL